MEVRVLYRPLVEENTGRPLDLRTCRRSAERPKDAEKNGRFRFPTLLGALPMPRLKDNQVPSYRLHKQSGQAIVTLSGRDHLLGKYGTKESRAKYDQLTGAWIANGRRDDYRQVEGLTIARILAEFVAHAKVRDKRRRKCRCDAYPWPHRPGGGLCRCLSRLLSDGSQRTTGSTDHTGSAISACGGRSPAPMAGTPSRIARNRRPNVTGDGSCKRAQGKMPQNEVPKHGGH